MTRLAKVSLLGALVLTAIAAPVQAHGDHHGGGVVYRGGGWGGWGGVYYPVMPYQGVYTVAVPDQAPPPPPQYYPQPYPQGYPQGYPMSPPDPEWQRMAERCSVPPRADNGIGGALIGGAVGGVIGNRVAEGDRTLGTVAGAAVGAIAGAAIDKAEDKGREQALREECDAWFAAHGGGAGYGYPGAGYGYPGYVMVPVMVQGQQEPCVETTTTTEEWVPVRQRVIHRRPAPRATKRVKEKRVWTGS